jgi:hypothetical protein
MEPCCDHATGTTASLFGGFESHLYDAAIFVSRFNTLETLRHSMNKNEQTRIPLNPFMKVAMAPVVIFALSNILLLPLVEAFFNFSNGSFLAYLVASTNNPFIQDFILIVAIMCFLPLSAAAVLIGPALTSFLVNLKCPISTSRSRAILCGGVFLFFYMILLDVLLIFRFTDNFQSIYGNYISLSSMKSSVFTPFMVLSFLDPLPCLLTIAGITLSYSVAVAGRFGAQKSSMKYNRRQKLEA